MAILDIVVCCHNRSQMAIECVEEIFRQVDDAARVILVDSASTAEEAEILRRFAHSVKDLHFIRCDVAGVSLARNAGIHASDGHWIVFVDDDALPYPDWYSCLRKSLASAPVDRVGIGGRVVARFPDNMRAPQLDETWLTYLSVVDRAEAGSVIEGASVVAANYAIRRDTLAQIGNFDEAVGRKQSSLISGGDSHITDKLINAGYDVWYDPSFVVHHRIPAERLQRRWIFRRVFMEGVSLVRMHRNDRPIPHHLTFAKLAVSLPYLVLRMLLSPWQPRQAYRLLRVLGGIREYLFGQSRHRLLG